MCVKAQTLLAFVMVNMKLCGIHTSIRINAVSTGQVTGDMYTEGCLGRKGAVYFLHIHVYIHVPVTLAILHHKLQ